MAPCSSRDTFLILEVGSGPVVVTFWIKGFPLSLSVDGDLGLTAKRI